MTNNEINIAIAEACGYFWMTKIGSVTTHHFAKYKQKDVEELESYGFIKGRHGHANEIDTYGLNYIPDYRNDLNAMAAVEKSLKEPERFAYEIILHKLNMKYGLGISVWETVHATAKQRAEAFLRLRELWVDD